METIEKIFLTLLLILVNITIFIYLINKSNFIDDLNNELNNFYNSTSNNENKLIKVQNYIIQEENKALKEEEEEVKKDEKKEEVVEKEEKVEEKEKEEKVEEKVEEEKVEEKEKEEKVEEKEKEEKVEEKVEEEEKEVQKEEKVEEEVEEEEKEVQKEEKVEKEKEEKEKEKEKVEKEEKEEEGKKEDDDDDDDDDFIEIMKEEEEEEEEEEDIVEDKDELDMIMEEIINRKLDSSAYFIELKRREELHTNLWHSEFGDIYGINDPIKLSNYEQKLMNYTGFLSSKKKKGLTNRQRLLQKMHQSLYSWLYGKRYKEFKDILRFSKGRGIVICTGSKHFKYARSTIDALRNVIKTNLPIEVFYIGKEDLSKEEKKILKEYSDVYLSDITKYLNNDILNIKGFSIKPLSVLASRFEEVILMDADVVYLMDPVMLFDEPEYIMKGTLFYQDRSLSIGHHKEMDWLKSWLMNPLPETTQLRYWNEKTFHEMESSTVVINKKKTILGLLSVCKLNENKIRDNFMYKYFHGDKETFWIGYDMAHQHYFMDPEPCSFIGELVYQNKNDPDSLMLCGHIAHLLSDGRLLYWNGHLTMDKNIPKFKNIIVKFEAHTKTGQNTKWLEKDRCLEINNYTQPIYFNSKENKTISDILDREKKYHFLLPETP